MSRFIKINLSLLILFNFLAAVLILTIPYDFAHSVEWLWEKANAKEESVLDKNTLDKLETITVNGPIQGHAEIVTQNP